MNKNIFIVVGIILIVFFIVPQEQEPEMMDMHGMPCHQMGDGSWMGDCDESTEAMMDMPVMMAEGFLVEEMHMLASLPSSNPPSMVTVEDGETFALSADVVRHTINGKEYAMYGYNQQIPGPIIKVAKESTITVAFTNNIDQETTIHWHGLRHDNKDDGVPGVSQDPVQPGETFEYTVYFPDDGVYWYHPHVREDLQQDFGLAGNMLVFPSTKAPVNKEEVIMLDDILIEQGEFVPYGEEHANFALMGRFGNTMLVNGQTAYVLEANKGDVVRLYLTNVANVRPFNLHIDGVQMKLVGSDMGMYEHEMIIDNIIIAPAERYIVDVYLENEGSYNIENKNPQKTYMMGSIVVTAESSQDDYSAEFNTLHTNNDVQQDIASFKEWFTKPVDYTLDLTVEMDMVHMMDMADHDDDGGIEWEDSMKMMNKQMTTEEVTWIIQDQETNKQNMDFTMQANVGDVIKIRLVNDPDSAHPMQHPMHLHGQRFLVLNNNGVPNDNLVWKDTVLVPKGSTIDILVDVTNPGEWMMHCHIAEHLEAGMMTSLMVS